MHRLFVVLLHTNHIHEYFLTTRPPSFKETPLSLLTGAESLKLPVCVCEKDSLVTKLQSVTHTSAYLCSWTDSSHGIKCTCKQWCPCVESKTTLTFKYSRIRTHAHAHTTQRPVLPALASCLPRQHFLVSNDDQILGACSLPSLHQVFSVCFRFELSFVHVPCINVISRFFIKIIPKNSFCLVFCPSSYPLILLTHWLWSRLHVKIFLSSGLLEMWL